MGAGCAEADGQLLLVWLSRRFAAFSEGLSARPSKGAPIYTKPDAAKDPKTFCKSLLLSSMSRPGTNASRREIIHA